MKVRSYLLLGILLFVSTLQACSGAGIDIPGTQKRQSTSIAPSLATASARNLPAPDAEGAARAFLQAWQKEDYAAMYAMLTPVSQDALTIERFTREYVEAANSMTLQKMDFEILSKLTGSSSAQVAYKVIFHTKMLGDITPDNITMNLDLEKSAWRVQWDDGLIMPVLHNGNSLTMDIKSPTRGNIYDRNGDAIAFASDVFAIGIVKGSNWTADQENTLLTQLSQLTGRTSEYIQSLYNDSSVSDGEYVPVAEVAADQVKDRYDVLSSLPMLRLKEYNARFYPDGGIAPHVTGYVQPIFAEEVDKYLREGYRLDDRVGKAGLERWGEKYLIGQRGASLYVSDPQGNTITRLGQVDSKPSQSIYMTIDSKLQWNAQQAIAGFNGAIVVMERNSGRVLALVSSPGYNPNAFEGQNDNQAKELEVITGDGRNRLYNRASGNGYPLGSVFKIITMAAALESGIFTPQDTINCGYDWTEIPGLTLSDWTKDLGVSPSGLLTLPEGLIRSCNPWFYHIGYQLFTQGHPKDISNMARAFGLGSPTGIDGLDLDESGNIPDPDSEQAAALTAIGQDKVLVNPLQVARFVAAVGNGGTLYRPQVVDRITDPDGKPSFTFQPDVQGKLPVSPENLQVIQDAMRAVIVDPHGTAVRPFSGLNIPVYGKTGTAQNDTPGKPHAWFAGYTDAGREDKPDIAFAVIAEYAGEGSEIAAPIARRILEVYFMGQAQRVFPWETRIDIARTPEPGQNSAPLENQPPADINVRTATPQP